MKTQEQLEAMSDRELEIILDKFSPETSKAGWKSLEPLKYCSNPNDIMPLVIEHKIDLVGYERFYLSRHENPYRVATIVLILLLQGE